MLFLFILGLAMVCEPQDRFEVCQAPDAIATLKLF
jgi:hypothetical protein